MSKTDTEIAEGYVALQHAPNESQEYDELFWASEEMIEVVAFEPQRALEIILMILAKDDSAEVVQILAAGPLEDLLAGHGETMIGKIEEEALSNQKFASLLGGYGQVRSATVSGGKWRHCGTEKDGTAYEEKRAQPDARANGRSRPWLILNVRQRRPMSPEAKARTFLSVYSGFLAVNVAWTIWTAVSRGEESAMARSVAPIALYGTLLFFLWRRSSGVRIFLGIAQVAGPLVFLLAQVVSSYRLEASAHLRMGIAIVFGLVLLFWKPMRDYTKKKPNQTPEPTAAAGRGSS